MTKKELEQYQSLKREIINQEKRIDALRDKEIPVVAGKVNSSMKMHPYTAIRVGVQMEDPIESQEIRELIAKKQKRIVELRRLVLEIEDFIKVIPESDLRQIFEYRFVDGKSQLEIGSLLHLDRSRISRKIREYLQDAHKAQKNVI